MPTPQPIRQKWMSPNVRGMEKYEMLFKNDGTDFNVTTGRAGIESGKEDGKYEKQRFAQDKSDPFDISRVRMSMVPSKIRIVMLFRVQEMSQRDGRIVTPEN